KLIRHTLGLTKKAVIFGGSWGSALALAYAAKYGEVVEALVLRGIFLGSREEVLWYIDELKRFIPEAHKELTWDIDGDLVDHYHARVNSMDQALASEASRRWDEYETQTMLIGSDVGDQKQESMRTRTDAELARSRVQLHYLKHGCFFEKDELLEKARSINNRTIIVQGGIDMICPPITAHRLHEALPDSKLNIVGTGGHGAWQSKIAEALLNEMELLKKQLHMNYGY
ncbi:MAG: alpha/beta fold hydrolase, partial [Proteobacteria bacterium]|nr:alpha/beta fold hydrolase [Pseudomonadota bacterium]